MSPQGLLPHIWGIAGVVLIIIELLTTAFIPAFFGIGALITGLCTWLGLTETLTTQLICFCITSLGSMFLFRNRAKTLFGKASVSGTEFSEFNGQRAVVTEEITNESEGRVMFRGAEWIALTETGEAISAGSPVIITGNDGIKLYVKSLKP